MRYAVLGDIHANLEALRAVLTEIDRLGVDGLACVGDVVGYCADPAECIDLLREREPVSVIRGNHDDAASRDDETPGFNPVATVALEWTRRNLSPEQKEWLRSLPLTDRIGDDVTLCHASLESPGRWSYLLDENDVRPTLDMLDTQVCFYGHVHVPKVFSNREDENGESYTRLRLDPGTRYLINVGSVGQPRDHDPRAAFVLYDRQAGLVELVRVEYDIAAAQKKILDAGLPRRLAERLARGA